MRIVIEQIFEQGAAIHRKIIVNRLLTVLNGHVIKFNVVNRFRNLGLQALLVSAEKLPNVCVSQSLFVGLRLFEASAGIRTEVFAFHFLEAARDLLKALVFQHFLHELFAVFVVFRFHLGVALLGRQKFLHL